MTNNSFAEAIYTALPYFIQLEAIQFLNSDIASFHHEKSEYSEKRLHAYDFIIVGAGTAGCILANRLSLRHTVLLLEAGGPPPFAVQVPGFNDYVVQSPELEYFYASTLMNRTITMARGKMLGGSHSHNALAYNRGNSKGYDYWAEFTNDSSWKYKHLLKYFKKSEKYSGLFSSDQHGTNGPVTVETVNTTILPAWLEAGEELGYNVVDPNGPQAVGVSPMEETIKAGRRQTTYTRYVEPILNTRNNLKLIKYANVIKVLINKNQANGVKYTRHGTTFRAFAKKEVILSAGVFGTPMLLFKSGIGPSEMLIKAGIKTVANLPVGQYLQDHSGLVVGDFKMKHGSKFKFPTLTRKIFEKYLKFEKESVLSNIGDDAQGFIASSIAQKNGEGHWPDIYIDIYAPTFKADIYGIAVQVTRPMFDKKYLGQITLNHTAYKLGVVDDTKLAIIDVKFLDNPTVFPILLHGIHTVLNITRTKAFEAVGSELVPDLGCVKEHTFKSDLYWKCVFMKKFEFFAHTVGTCRMGPGNGDLESVVDSKLRLNGINRLRIADASIIPQNSNSNTNAVVMAIAEKAADMILKSNRRKIAELRV